MKKREKTRLGRPPKFGAERTRGPLTVRLRDRVRADLEAASSASGRSLSEEMEHRIELALHGKDAIREAWGHDVFDLAEAFSRALWHIEQHTGRRWIEDPKTFDLFALTVGEIIRSYRELVVRHRRERLTGVLEGKSPNELAQMFAGMAGISPPRPRDAREARDPEREYHDRQASIASWNESIERMGSRPIRKAAVAAQKSKGAK